MKKIITLVALALSINVFAINENSSWSEIKAALKADFKLQATGTTVFVGRPVSAFDVCIDGDNFVTTKKFPIYKNVRVPRSQDHDGDNDGYTNVKVGEEYLTFPITYTSHKEVCRHNDKNCKVVAYTVVQETVKEVTISKFQKRVGGSRNGNDRDLYKTLFTKDYEIAQCE